MDVSSAPRRNSYTEGASKQKKLLTPENKLQKHGSESSLGNSIIFDKEVNLEIPSLFEVLCMAAADC